MSTRTAAARRAPLLCALALLLGALALPAHRARAADPPRVRDCTEAGLLAAVDATGGSGTVRFDCGGPATITLSATIRVPADTSLTISGEGLVTISGGGAVRVFSVAPRGSLALEGLTISGGAAPGDRGGAVLNEGLLSLSDVALVDNQASSGGALANVGTATATQASFLRNRASVDGGAIASTGGSLSLTDSRLSSNSAGGVGGALATTAPLTLLRTVLSGNSASSGGALHSSAGATPTVRDSELSGNRATADGGAIASTGALSLVSTTVSENSAGNSGGGLTSSGALTLTNSTVSGNRAAGNGGGITSLLQLQVTSSTVANNDAAGSGGGIYGPTGTGVLTTTLLAGNRAAAGPDCAANLGSGGANLLQRTAGCALAAVAGDLLGVDPLLEPLADNGGPARTHGLRPGSPAVDAVALEACALKDQREVNRPVGDGCDIGAYELGFVVNSLADAPDANPAVGTCETAPPRVCTLRAAVQQANALFGRQAITFAVTGTVTLSPAAVDPELEPDGMADLDIIQDLYIIGRGAPATVVDGAGDPEVGGVLHIAAGARVTLRGVTLRRGDAGASRLGGGVRNEGELVLKESQVSGSRADRGGGISSDGPLTVTRATISGNSAADAGGGIYVAAGGLLTVSDTTVSGNTAGAGASGGGISSEAATALTNVTVSDNSAGQNGGGIAMLGGGAGALRMNNVTVAGNAAGTDAGQGGDGGGLYMDALRSEVLLTNSLLASNEDRSSGVGARYRPDCSGVVTSLGYNLMRIASGCTMEPADGDKLGTANAPVEPRLSQLRDNGGPTPTRALLTGSPALNAGSPAPLGALGNACAAADQRGAGRPQGGTCDIGANEAYLADIRVQQTTSGMALVGSEVTYRVTVTNVGPSPTGGVALTNVLPPSATLLQASASQGGCAVQQQGVGCSIGRLEAGASATVLLVVRPVTASAALSIASAAATEADPSPNNNSSTTRLSFEYGRFLPRVEK